jgi:plasmid stability protein
MPTLTIKGMPDSLYRQLKKRAAAHRRSLNAEILVSLERSVAAAAPDARQLLARVDRLRDSLPDRPPLTERQIRQAKSWGRP